MVLPRVSGAGAAAVGTKPRLRLCLPASYLTFSANTRLPPSSLGMEHMDDHAVKSGGASSSSSSSSTDNANPQAASSSAVATMGAPAAAVAPRLLPRKKRALPATVPPSSHGPVGFVPESSSEPSRSAATPSSTEPASAPETALVLYQRHLNTYSWAFDSEHEPARKRLCTGRVGTERPAAALVGKK
ncbi:hypothetical protein PMIN07_012264 [Paraphaeosphaeria minitans]